MNQYIEPIRSALVSFPLVALLITLPYMLMQYRRYGAVLFFRAALVYSFVLYLMCAYFLVILPLPSVEKVRALTSARIQLVPFLEVAELFQKAPVDWAVPATWYRLVWNRSFFQIAANVLMLMPFGIYLRYYFGFSFQKTVLYSFLLSLFFELTQLTGLYGLYPRPYRLADVDDLITNTLGGMLGYAVAPLFMRVLPTREQLDARAYHKGEQVSVTRRAFAALVDVALMALLALVVLFTVPATYPTGKGARDFTLWMFTYYSASIGVYFVLGEWLTGGRSLGKSLLRLRLVDRRTGKRPKLWQCVVRYFVLYLVVAPTPAVILLIILMGSQTGYSLWMVLGCLALLAVYMLFWLLLAIHVLTHDNKLLHDKLSMTQNVSTLRHPFGRHRHKKEQPKLPS